MHYCIESISRDNFGLSAGNLVLECRHARSEIRKVTKTCFAVVFCRLVFYQNQINYVLAALDCATYINN